LQQLRADCQASSLLGSQVANKPGTGKGLWMEQIQPVLPVRQAQCIQAATFS